MTQTRLSSIAIINIEKAYANRVYQESIDRIINISGKRKKCESFLFKTLEPEMRSVHVLISLLYCVSKINSKAY